jgi:hypothetical protein
MRTFVRAVFACIVHLHPRPFRTEFGDEMLWLFDEQVSCEEQGTRIAVYAGLLFDVLRSAFVQHAFREHPQPETVRPHFGQIGSSARMIQVAQGGFIAFSCLFGVFSIILCLRMVISSL